MLHRIIKHSEVEEQYTKEELNAFYNKVKHDLIKEIFDNPYDEENSIIRVLDYSVIENLV